MPKREPSPYFVRENIIRAIRNFFYENNFHEVETPLLVPAVIPESYLEYFSTELIDRHGKKTKMFLVTSPEASIKKLLSHGIGNCFEISKSFRNRETGSTLHLPEFTILEWYRAGATYRDIMRDCENLFIYIYHNLNSKTQNSKLIKNLLYYQNLKIDLTPPWPRISVIDALKKYAGINFDDITEVKSAAPSNIFKVKKIAGIAAKKGYRISSNSTWEMLFNQIFLNEVEPKLAKIPKPVIIYDYPAPLAALAKLKNSDKRLAERFELYTGGLELADCYTELTDYREQKQRFEKEMLERERLAKSRVTPDHDFLEAVRSGLPDCSGIAMGIDRLAMLFTDSKTIQDTLLFP